MARLPIHLALHGVLILTISILGGLFLYKAILEKKNEADWHLLHAGGSARGILLIALASIIHIPVLPQWPLATAVWLKYFLFGHLQWQWFLELSAVPLDLDGLALAPINLSTSYMF